MVSRSSVVFLALFACAAATDVLPCTGKSAGGQSPEVELVTCNKGRCKLKQGTTQHVSVKFTPEKDIADLKNKVNAEILGLALPFVGVDGTSACDKLYTESGEKASCPLKAGESYTYKDSFPIEKFYPTISLKVHWELVHGTKEHTVTCFEVPAKIVK